jgi:hypothetical protein
MDAKIDQPWSVLALQAPVRGAVARHRCGSVFRYLSILIHAGPVIALFRMASAMTASRWPGSPTCAR